MKTGDNVIIQGRILPDDKVDFVEISFVNNERGTERLLLLRIEPKSKKIVAKRYLNGGWENYRPAEQSDVYPFVEDKLFTLELKVTERLVRVFVNGEPFSDYKIHAALSIAQVGYIQVGGSADTYTVTLRGC